MQNTFRPVVERKILQVERLELRDLGIDPGLQVMKGIVVKSEIFRLESYRLSCSFAISVNYFVALYPLLPT